MDRRIFISASLIASALPWSVKAEGPASKTTPAPGVTSVEIQTDLDLTVVQGDQESLILTGDAARLARLKAIVANGNLLIEGDDSSGITLFGRLGTVEGRLTVKSLEKLSIDGSGAVTIGAMKTARLEVDISGSTKLNFADLHTDALDLRIKGRGDIKGTGTATGVVVQISGSGDAKLLGLQASVAKVTISGKGNVELAVKDRLDAHVAGYGNVHYLGDPKVTRTVSGLGEVSPVGG